MARRRGGQSDREEAAQLIERVVGRPRRVAKVVRGGRRFSFSALAVVGDGRGRVGFGLGKAREVAPSIHKALDTAKRSMFAVPMVGTTIPHEIRGEASGAVVMLKPASPGTGVIAGGPVRAVLDCAGIRDILSKSLGSNNSINIVHATVQALRSLELPEDVARRRRKTVEEVAPPYLLRPPETPEAGPIGG